MWGAEPDASASRADGRAGLPDARVQLVLLVALTVSTFASRSWRGVVLAAALLVPTVACARVSAPRLLRGLRPTVVVLALALLANAVVVGSGGVTLSDEGAARGALACARILVVVGAALVVAFSVTAEQAAEALAGLLAPLRHLGVPVGDVSLATSVALRFVPVVSEEVTRVTSAQRARGARFGEGNVVERARQWGRVLVPVSVGLFRRSDELALALYDRCYGVGERTRMMPTLGRRDVAWLVGGLVACVAVWAL